MIPSRLPSRLVFERHLRKLGFLQQQQQQHDNKEKQGKKGKTKHHKSVFYYRSQSNFTSRANFEFQWRVSVSLSRTTFASFLHRAVLHTKFFFFLRFPAMLGTQSSIYIYIGREETLTKTPPTKSKNIYNSLSICTYFGVHKKPLAFSGCKYHSPGACMYQF